MNGLRLLWELADYIRDTDSPGGCGGCPARGSNTCHVCIADRIESIAMEIEREDKLAADWVKSAGGLERVSAAWDWVRRHGGLEAVIDRWASSIPVGNARNTMRRAEERRQALAAHARHLEGLLSERRREIGRLRREAAEMRRRLIPEDMEWLVEEWPRFEDGAPLGRGDEMATSDGVVKADEFSLTICDEDGGVTSIDFGERVKRPAPKVLDAYGAEIRSGETVWRIDTGGEYWVAKGKDEKVTPSAVTIRLKTDNDCSPEVVIPSQLTHRAPVLAVGGKPLREGETVWHVTSAHEYTVRAVTTHGAHLSKDGNPSGYCRAEYLIHERPDSWDRLEDDTAKNPFDYCRDVGHRLDTCENAEAYKARDLVRRAKKLAGVSE